MTTEPVLPNFPRPDLPMSHPENYPTLRVRHFRRLGLPDDGGVWVQDAIAPVVLHDYNGVITSDNDQAIMIDFASVADAVAWAGMITETGSDRSMITFSSQPYSPYQPVTVLVSLAGDPSCPA